MERAAYEFLDDSVEDQAIIVAFFGMHHKILHGLGRHIREEAQVDVTLVGVHDGKVGCPRAFGLGSQGGKRLLFPSRSLVVHVAVESFRVGITTHDQVSAATILQKDM